MFPAKPAAHTCGITATWINHSTFLLQTTRGNILTGPVYGPRTSPVSWAGPRRTHAPGIAYHWSNHELSARNRRLWSGFFLETGEATAHFVGDTGYDSPKFGLIRARLGAPDLAMIPIGAYEPRWFMATTTATPRKPCASITISAHDSASRYTGHFSTHRQSPRSAATGAGRLARAFKHIGKRFSHPLAG